MSKAAARGPHAPAAPKIAPAMAGAMGAAPMTPEAFVETEDWRSAIVRGWLVRENYNGFVILTPEGNEERFFPARIGPTGAFELNPTTKDFVAEAGLIGAPTRCNELPSGVHNCVALTRDGREISISQAPIERPL
jgi:hypothetical protein